MQLPTLYKRNENGSIQQWTIEAYGTGLTGVIRAVYGQVGGKLQETTDAIGEGKNIGRANETTPLEQAEAEAQSRWEQKLKKGYVRSLEDAQNGKVDAVIQGGVAPMLAHKYVDHGHKISYPAFAQPKLDGHRCVAVLQGGKCELWSRTRKRITGVPHIERAIEAQFPGETIVLDGELYNHEYHDNFEALTSFIRSATPKPGHEVVQYWIYDVIGDANQAGRLARLDNHQLVLPLVALPTELVENEEQMVAVFGAYLANNFEGLMLRNRFASYKNGRSYDLQKVKTMQDAEFPVIRVEEGRGRMAGLALFVCETPEGKEFRVKMEGALDDLAKYVQDPSLAVGRQLTVRYQNMTAEGLPRFPVAERFREDV